LTVTSPADSGDGSLRAVIAEAQSGDQIVFDDSLRGQTITLTSGELAVTKDLDIEGPGPDQLAVRGGGDRVFETDGRSVTITGLTITNGVVRSPAGGFFSWPAMGGGIYNGGNLTLANVVVENNQAVGGDASNFGVDGQSAQGGGIYSTGGLLSISGSVIADNLAMGGHGINGYSGNQDGTNGGTGSGGGLYVDGGSLDISNSTIAHNMTRGGYGGTGVDYCIPSPTRCYSAEGGFGGAGQGGGLYANGAFLTISTSTIASNQAVGGFGGIGGYPGRPGDGRGGGLSNGGMLQTRDTIFADNTVPGPGYNSGPDLSGALGSLGHNLIGNSAGGSGFDATDLLDIDPMLGPLQDNGGPTQTMALLSGSPAIDAGDNTDAPMWDQRGPGYPRIVNGVIDIGAFEVQAPSASRASGQPLPDPLPALGLPPPADGPGFLFGTILPGSATTPSLPRGIAPDQETSAGPQVVSGDQGLASSDGETSGSMVPRWSALEPIQASGPNPDLSPEETGLAV
jgi:hypothetical protein